MSNGNWQFWIDRGGTFTDVVALQPDGTLATAKLLSDNAAQYSDAAAEGVQRLRAAWADAGGDNVPVDAIKMGTTVATNALLERRGSRTALLLTRGFEDALVIGYQNRPDIFALDIQRPAPLYEQVLGIDERVAADGEVLRAPDESSVRAQLGQLRDDGIDSVAICLLHGYRYHAHEARVAQLARECGFSQVSVSHEVEPLIKYVGRADTTLADAYLTPVLMRYIDGLRAALADVAMPKRLQFMQSNGGLTDANRFRGKDSILSGPAGGVVGMAEAARAAGLERLVGFDMGGTSTDVSAYAGAFERQNDNEIAGVRLRAPMMAIHTIAAGGGSVLRYADERFQVGPASAGANPGPRCYRQDGPLTVTDANVLLGRIPAEFFPAVFGPGGDEPLDTGAVEAAFAELAAEISAARDRDMPAEEVAAGFLTVAIESMANAIRKITIERGEDVRDYTLCCFGGAGGQHACRLADTLGMQRIWLHPLAGVLSAYGMGLADVRIEKQQSVEKALDTGTLADVAASAASLQAACGDELATQQVAADAQAFVVSCGLRVAGSDNTIDVPLAGLDDMRDAFDAAYRARFGAERGDAALWIATIGVAGTGRERTVAEPGAPRGPAPSPAAHARVWLDGDWIDAPVFERDRLTTESNIAGPAIIAEPHGTTVVEPGWRASVNDHAHLLLERERPDPDTHRSGNRVEPSLIDTDTRKPDRPVEPDPVRLEVFNRLFMNIAEQMGSVLQRTAVSVNIRERLDFSCALFDDGGRLVSNAPHMPVHLGSMGESVRSVIEHCGERLGAGDAVMLNSPYNGGTHLPDITVVSPWFGDDGRIHFYVASRAHHADVGGITPGSMPASSAHIDEEGVLLDNVWLVRHGKFREITVREKFGGARWPARNVAQNIADLQAQLAANRQGMRALDKAVARYSLAVVRDYLGFVRANAEASVRRLLDRLHDGCFELELDSGECICVDIRVDRKDRSARIDFAGTSPQSPTNFNAPSAVTRAAVLYVFRTLVDDEIPMNEGCLAPLDVRIPAGSLLSPEYPAAVVAGNVETSQCVTDALYGALGSLAASQGTMNNLSFGNDAFQYYETIAGGAGAGPGFHGASGVQTHMTNSRLTDTEVLERVCPVRVERFSLRSSSGGNGRYRGGDGLVRELRFLEDVDVTILSNRRRVPPFGLGGGMAAKPGITTIVRSSGARETLPATATVRLAAGDRVCVETPGGGGFGPPANGDD